MMTATFARVRCKDTVQRVRNKLFIQISPLQCDLLPMDLFLQSHHHQETLKTCTQVPSQKAVVAMME